MTTSKLIRNKINDDTDTINIIELLTILWLKKSILVLGTLLIAGVFLIYALLSINTYKSEVTLISSNSESTSNGMSSLIGGVSGIASLAGINLNQSGDSKVSYALAVLKSKRFMFSAIKASDLKLMVMASKSWNRETGAVELDPAIFDKTKQKWVRDVNPPFETEPSLQETYTVIMKKHFSVHEDKDTGIIKLAFTHFSPKYAKKILEFFVERLNEEIRQQDLEEANRSIEFLMLEAKQTQLSEMQSMFFKLIEKHQQTKLLAKVRKDYVLKILDPAVASELHNSPNRLLIVTAGFILGFVLSCLIVILQFLYVRQRLSI